MVDWKRVRNLQDDLEKGLAASIKNEDDTKNLLVEPFLAALGYEVWAFDPAGNPVKAEYKGVGHSRADYALFQAGEEKPSIVVECKSVGVDLTGNKPVDQLLDYFSKQNTSVGVLTDGLTYRLHTCETGSQFMDTAPFCEFDLRNLREESDISPLLERLTRGQLDVDGIRDWAWEANLITALRRVFTQQLEHPSIATVRNWIKMVPVELLKSKVLSERAVREFYMELYQKAFRGWLESNPLSLRPIGDTLEQENSRGDCQAFLEAIRSVCAQLIDASRIVIEYNPKKPSYYAVKVEWATLCRLYANYKKISIQESSRGRWTQYPVEQPSDIHRYSQQLTARISWLPT